MSNQFQRFFGSQQTPQVIKWLIAITLAASVLFPLATYLILNYIPTNGADFFSLSLWGIKQGFVWQFITYLFTAHGQTGVSFLLSLLFDLLLLWAVGSLLVEEFGNRHFLFLYLGSGIFAGIIGFLLMLSFSSSFFLSGSTPAVFGMLFAAAMLFPDLEVGLFFVIRIKIKWAIFVFIGITLLASIISLQWILLVSELAAIFWVYIYGVIILRLKSPFLWLHPLDRWFHSLTFNWHSYRRRKTSKKIIDLNDELFMDKMLEKISKHGEKSLTGSEIRKMKRISKRKGN